MLQDVGFPPGLRVRETVDLVRAHFPQAASRDAILERLDLAGAGEEDFVWLIAGGDEGGWDMAAFVFRQGGFTPAYLVMSSE